MTGYHMHYMVNGQSLCGHGITGFKQFNRVEDHPNACPDCIILGRNPEASSILTHNEVYELRALLRHFKEFMVNRVGNSEYHLALSQIQSQMEKILNK